MVTFDPFTAAVVIGAFSYTGFWYQVGFRRGSSSARSVTAAEENLADSGG